MGLKEVLNLEVLKKKELTDMESKRILKSAENMTSVTSEISDFMVISAPVTPGAYTVLERLIGIPQYNGGFWLRGLRDTGKIIYLYLNFNEVCVVSGNAITREKIRQLEDDEIYKIRQVKSEHFAKLLDELPKEILSELGAEKRTAYTIGGKEVLTK